MPATYAKPQDPALEPPAASTICLPWRMCVYFPPRPRYALINCLIAPPTEAGENPADVSEMGRGPPLTGTGLPEAPIATVRIGIAAEHRLFREGLKALFQPYPDLAVVAETDRAEGIAPMLGSHRCRVLCLDLHLGSCMLAKIPSFAASVRVVGFSKTADSDDHAQAALRQGAGAVICGDWTSVALIDAIRTLAAGGAPPQQRLTSWPGHPLNDVDLVSALTDREREIVRCVGMGLRNAEAAANLGITEHTIKSHLKTIFLKLDVRDRVELALFAAKATIPGAGERHPGDAAEETPTPHTAQKDPRRPTA